jgi:hypothetical protein
LWENERSSFVVIQIQSVRPVASHCRWTHFCSIFASFAAPFSDSLITTIGSITWHQPAAQLICIDPLFSWAMFHGLRADSFCRRCLEPSGHTNGCPVVSADTDVQPSSLDGLIAAAQAPLL